MKKIVFALCAFWGVSMHSQAKIPFQNSKLIFQESVEARENGDFEKSLNLLKSINENDSLYVSSLKDQTYYLLQLKKYEEAIALADKGMVLETELSTSTFYINKSVALIGSKRYDEALTVLKEGLKKFPASPLLYYNKGVCLTEMGKIKEAVEAYQMTIQQRPYYAAAHLKLGNLCYQQGLFAQALMCFNTYLLINPDSSNSLEILKSLNNAVTAKFPEKNTSVSFSVDDSNYDKIDVILNSHIALNERYTIDNEINIALNKQNHALLAEIKNLPKTDDFWGNYYIPLFEWIKEENHFNNFTYTICYMNKNEEYQKIIQANKDNIIEFVKLFRQKWTSLIRIAKVKTGDQIQTLYSNYEEGKMTSRGVVVDNKAVGLWNYFYDSGELLLEGVLDENEERHGRWTWYHNNGTVKETADYDHGKIGGNNKIYYRNGELSIDAEVKDGDLNGKYLYYNQGGALAQKKYFKSDSLDGKYLAYFAAGESMLEFDVDYKQGDIVGTALEFHSNGAVFRKSFYQNGKLQREEEFFDDGKPSLEKNYRDGIAEGSYKKYHHNQQLALAGQYKEGEQEGVWKSYYTTGQLEDEVNYSKGSLNGIYKYYHVDGKPYYEMTYRKGELIGFVYFDKDGKVLSKGKKKGGEFNYRGHNPNGSILSEGLYDVSGGKEGIWKFYSPNGVLIEKGNYVAGQPVGEHPNFFDNGDVQVEQRFENGTVTGYYAEYYKNRKIKTQGWYLDGQPHGEWRNYYKDGTLSNISYFHNGELNGCSSSFGVEGKIDSKSYYKFGELTKEVAFNSAGTSFVIFDLYNTQEKEVVNYDYVNGKTRGTISYLNKVKHGPFSIYGFTGNLVSEGNYVNNQVHGKIKYYYDSGQLQYDYNYSNGEFHGEQLEYHENGKVSQRDFYRYGTREKQESYYENGTISTEKSLLNGQLHGAFKLYDVNGMLQIVRYYEKGNLIGYSYEDKNGHLLPMIPLKNATGKAVAYYRNGKISREMEFFNNNLVNNYKAYYTDGTLESDIQFVANDYNGTYLEYYPNGKLKNEKNYLYDTLHGLQKSYYDNGQLKHSQYYLNGSKSGEGKFFSKSGKLTKEVSYHNGVMNALKE